MRCPKCEEGELIKIRFKKNNSLAYLCTFCTIFWFANEEISAHSGRDLRAYSGEEEREYTVVELDEKDQEHKSASHVDFK